MQLFKAQRIELEKLIEAKVSKKKIALALGVHISTIYREIKRNSIDGKYDGKKAHELALARKKIVGSFRKYKRKNTHKRKNKYELYADRRFIYWHSDTPWVRRKYFFLFDKRIGRLNRYRIRLGMEKIFHYKNDIDLLDQLVRFEKKRWELEKKKTQQQKELLNAKCNLKTIHRQSLNKEVA